LIVKKVPVAARVVVDAQIHLLRGLVGAFLEAGLAVDGVGVAGVELV
jgi:hypothetical protein